MITWQSLRGRLIDGASNEVAEIDDDEFRDLMREFRDTGSICGYFITGAESGPDAADVDFYNLEPGDLDHFYDDQEMIESGFYDEQDD